MRYILPILFLWMISPGSVAGSCDYSSPKFFEFNQMRFPASVEYKHVRMKPGYRLSVGDFDYELVKMPFIDLSTGVRYAVTYPVIVNITPTGKMVQASLSVSNSVFESGPCSDVAVGESKSPVHKIAATEHLTVSVSSMNGKQMLRSSRLHSSTVSFRTESTDLALNIYVMKVQIVGCENLLNELASGEKNGDWECPASVNSEDHDLTNHIDWSKLRDPTKELLRGLDRLIDYVYVERMD